MLYDNLASLSVGLLDKDSTVCAGVEGYLAAGYNCRCAVVSIFKSCSVCPEIADCYRNACVIACIDNSCYLIGDAVFVIGTSEGNAACS